jgi:hypothetical protein
MPPFCTLLHSCCVIQSQHELGMGLIFWENESKKENPDVLPMTRPG